MSELEKTYIPTKEVKSTLGVRDCDVMHLRQAGKIEYVKNGNSFWYLRADVDKLVKDQDQ
jgi:hypothetical protein